LVNTVGSFGFGDMNELMCQVAWRGSYFGRVHFMQTGFISQAKTIKIMFHVLF